MSLQTHRMTKELRFRVYPSDAKAFEDHCDKLQRGKADVLREWFRDCLREKTDADRENEHSGSTN